MMNKDHNTGYPSIDKPWLKYYSEEAINAHYIDKSITQSGLRFTMTLLFVTKRECHWWKSQSGTT